MEFAADAAPSGHFQRKTAPAHCPLRPNKGYYSAHNKANVATVGTADSFRKSRVERMSFVRFRSITYIRTE